MTIDDHRECLIAAAYDLLKAMNVTATEITIDWRAEAPEHPEIRVVVLPRTHPCP